MESAKRRKHKRPGHRGGREPRAFTLSTHWRTGPRTRAWDELWRWLLAPDDVHPSGSASPGASSDREQRPGR